MPIQIPKVRNRNRIGIAVPGCCKSEPPKTTKIDGFRSGTVTAKYAQDSIPVRNFPEPEPAVPEPWACVVIPTLLIWGIL